MGCRKTLCASCAFLAEETLVRFVAGQRYESLEWFIQFSRLLGVQDRNGHLLVRHNGREVAVAAKELVV